MADGPFKSLDDIRRANESIGHYWFNPETKEFFNSVWDEEVIGGRYFASAEAYDMHSECRWSIRCAADDGSIETIGPLGAYASRIDAKDQAQFIASAPLRARPDQEVYRPCEGPGCAVKDHHNWAVFELPIGKTQSRAGLISTEVCLELCSTCIPAAVDALLRPQLSDQLEPPAQHSPDTGLSLET